MGIVTDFPLSTTVLYNIDTNRGVLSFVKYDNHSKTVKEYGWRDLLLYPNMVTYNEKLKGGSLQWKKSM